jgi:hypothetical protein
MDTKVKCSACGGKTDYNSLNRKRFVEGWGLLCVSCWRDLGESYPFPMFLERKNFSKKKKIFWGRKNKRR